MKQKTIRFWQLWRKIKSILVRERDASDFFIVNFGPDPEDFMRKLIPLGYQYNYFSYDFKDQICNVRKLVLNPRHPSQHMNMRTKSGNVISGCMSTEG